MLINSNLKVIKDRAKKSYNKLNMKLTIDEEYIFSTSTIDYLYKRWPDKKSLFYCPCIYQ